jgi:hypothetical protein
MLQGLMVVGGLLLVVAAVWLFWLNRGSETLRSNGITALVVGIVGLLATLWFSLKPPEDRHHRFPVVFVLDKVSRLPVPPWEGLAAVQYADPAAGLGVFPALAMKGLKDEVLPSVRSEDNGALAAVYLDVLLSYVTDALCSVFSRSWDVEVSTFETAQANRTTVEPRVPFRSGLSLSVQDLLSEVPHAEFALSPPRRPNNMVVPLGTRTSGWEATDPRTRVLRMSNAFVRLSVEIAWESYALGSGGLAPLIGMSPTESQEKTICLSYVVTLDASFEKLRSGHPDMPDHVR